MNDNIKTPQSSSNINAGSIEGLVDISEVHFNVSQEVIITTEDKVRLCLSRHLGKMEKKKSWIAPLGILLTIILTLTTSDFTDKGLKAVEWKAIFVIAGFLTMLWLIHSAKEAFQSEPLEDIIGKLKKDSKTLKK